MPRRAGFPPIKSIFSISSHGADEYENVYSLVYLDSMLEGNREISDELSSDDPYSREMVPYNNSWSLYGVTRG